MSNPIATRFVSPLVRYLAIAIAAGTSLGAQTPASATFPPPFPRDGAKQLLDNAWGTAWEATWPPNKPTPMHRHLFDYVGIELADATFRVTTPGAEPKTSSRSKGDSWFLPRGVTHNEEGLSVPGRHAIVIDLKDTTSPPVANTTGYPALFPAGVANQVVDNARVTMWSYTMRADAPGGTYFYPRNAFVVVVDSGTMTTTAPGGRAETRAVVPGQLFFRPGGGAWLDRATKGTIRLIVVLLK